MDLPGQFRGVSRNRIDRDRGLQVVEERTAGLTAFCGVGAMHAVDEFGYADRAHRRFAFTDPFGNELQEASHVETLPLGLDRDTGIEPRLGIPFLAGKPSRTMCRRNRA